jgi:hypothetical protein
MKEIEKEKRENERTQKNRNGPWGSLSAQCQF